MVMNMKNVRILKILSVFLAMFWVLQMWSLPAAATAADPSETAATEDTAPTESAPTESEATETAAPTAAPSHVDMDSNAGVDAPRALGGPDQLDFDAEALLLLELNSETMVYAKNIDTRREPASLTKVMTCLLALEHGEPLDEAVYCEVMFDKRTSGEVPEHRAFIYETALPRLERLGIPVRVLRSDKTYLDLFAGTVTRGPKKGLRRGFPLCGHCYVQRDCKLRPIRRYNRTLTPDTVQYVGIASDEPVRLCRLQKNKRSVSCSFQYSSISYTPGLT